MNAWVILAVAFATATAKPLQDQIVSVTQDTFGNYDLKFAINGISRAEHRDADGLVSGGYAYIDPHGVVRKTIYTSGVHGFHAIGTDIPLPVADTPEVAIAKSAHIELLRAAKFAQPVPVAAVPVAAPAAFPVPAVRSVPVAAVSAPAAVFEVPAAPLAPAYRTIPVSEIPVAPPAAVFAPAPAVRSVPVEVIHAPVVIPESPDVLDAEGRRFTGEHLIHK